jgi:glyoxylase-like metal-dependent hydrolase (beta-lactamase superfamily II)
VMARIEYSVYVAPAKDVVTDDLPPGADRRVWSPTTATLVHGERDAILVDALLTIEESRALTDWVTAARKNLTAVYITHAHGDHFLGVPAVLERFPQARIVATPGVAGRMEAEYSARWEQRFPGQVSPQRVSAEPLADGVLELEGEELHAVELGHTDTNGSSALHVPPIGLVVAGDAVYGDVHQFLSEANGGGGRQWLNALDTIEKLQPLAVVAGHKRDGDPDDPEQIENTRRYIEHFLTAADQARSFTDLYDVMVALYPQRLNRGALWNSAKAYLS